MIRIFKYSKPTEYKDFENYVFTSLSKDFFDIPNDKLTISGVDYRISTMFLLSEENKIEKDFKLTKRTTDEIFAILNPEEGEMYLNTDEDEIVYYTATGWKKIGGLPLQRIAYSNDFENGLNGFRISSYYGSNYFILGKGASFSGTHSLHITKDGTNATYDANSRSLAKARVDIDIPIGAKDIHLIFNWKAEGERNYDYGRVYIINDSGTEVRIGASQYEGTSTWKNEVIGISSSYAGTIRTFVFEWRNDNNTGGQPPFCIDNVELKYSI